jgi:DNA replication protein DnaC
MFQNSVVCPECSDIGWVITDRGSKRCNCWVNKWLRKTIPKRFTFSSFENYVPEDGPQRNAKSTLEENISGSFLICGGYGRGKTHLLFSQYRRLVESGTRCLLRIGRDVTKELTECEIEGKPAPIQIAAESPFPVHFFWDDADKIKPSEFKEEVLFELIDTIYRQQHAITISSNCDLVSLGNIFSAAIIRRLDEICHVVCV